MKILITGGNGFLGRNLQSYLKGAHEVVTLGRNESCDIQADLSQSCPELPFFDLVIHAAGKAHDFSSSEEDAYYQVNTQGTQYLLEALEKEPPASFVFISTVAVYGKDDGENWDEQTSLQGQTPYAKSKIKAEELLTSWSKKHNVASYIFRLPLISGTNPPGNLGKMIKAIRKGFYFRIGKGAAIKSMVGTADLAALLPHLSGQSGIYNLTDGRGHSIADIDTHIAKMLKKKVIAIPDFVLKLIATVGGIIPGFPLNRSRYNKLNSTLTFSDAKARKELNWNPKDALDSLSFDTK